MDSYNFNENSHNNNGYVYQEQRQGTAESIVKVFAYMFMGLAITAGVAFGLYYLLISSVMSVNAYYPMLIGSSIGLIFISFFSQLYLLKGHAKGGLVAYILYAIVMGVLLSSLFIIYDAISIGYAFLCTAGSFGAMALYGLLTKRQTYSMGMLGVGLLFGALTLGMVNWLIGSTTIYWIVTYACLIAMLLITAWDVNRTKQLAENGMMTQSLAIYMALQLYTDFIYIFIRLVSIIGSSRR